MVHNRDKLRKDSLTNTEVTELLKMLKQIHFLFPRIQPETWIQCSEKERYKITHTGTMYMKYKISEMKIHWVSTKRCCCNYQCTILTSNHTSLDHPCTWRQKLSSGDQKGEKHFVCDIFKLGSSEHHHYAMKLGQSSFTDMDVTNDWGMLKSMSLIKDMMWTKSVH